jgi:hypothetical protein
LRGGVGGATPPPRPLTDDQQTVGDDPNARSHGGAA